MLETKRIECDFCVIGGGLAGICAAIAAARHGAKTVLMHERPMFGGNASSEIRMWPCGAGLLNNETGIIEEIELENLYRNPTKNFAIWDNILYDFVLREKNITPLLNCTCMDAETEEGTFSDGRTRRITAVKGYQMTTQRFYEVRARLFADCSGDSILAPLAGADFMLGRESREMFGESTHVTEKDDLTMGMSCLLTARETTRGVRYIPSERAAKLTGEQFRPGCPNMKDDFENFWYLELGGNRDSIGDTEELRDDLVNLALGTWDYIKNSGKYDCENYDLDFLGFLPGKRESRRLRGEYILNANDILSDRAFPDVVAFGGWPVDDHYPDGFYHKGTPNTNFKTPPCYQIPYRTLYSANVDNLFFAGRNISATHMALSSTRVMKTCSLLGQAIGTAAAIAAKDGLTPHGVYEKRLSQLQETLMRDDCFLPTKTRRISDACKTASLSGAINADAAAAALRDAVDRVNEAVYRNTASGCGCSVENGKPVVYRLENPAYVEEIHLVFDSDLERKSLPGSTCERVHATRANIRLDSPQVMPPKSLCRRFSVEITDACGKTETLFADECNIRRCINLPVRREVSAIALIPAENWGGSKTTNVFSFDF